MIQFAEKYNNVLTYPVVLMGSQGSTPLNFIENVGIDTLQSNLNLDSKDFIDLLEMREIIVNPEHPALPWIAFGGNELDFTTNPQNAHFYFIINNTRLVEELKSQTW